jgi:hypothetical protein
MLENDNFLTVSSARRLVIISGTVRAIVLRIGIVVLYLITFYCPVEDLTKSLNVVYLVCNSSVYPAIVLTGNLCPKHIYY